MSDSVNQNFVLVLDPNPQTAQWLADVTKLAFSSYRNPNEALSKSDWEQEPCAIFLDLPDLGNRLETMAALREKWPYCPILLMTEHLDKENLLRHLQAGAVDFLRKPLSGEELNTRLSWHLEEAKHATKQQMVSFADVVIDSARRQLSGNLGSKSSSPIEIALLSYLAKSNGTYVDKETLKLKCWGALKVSDNALHRKLHAVRQILRDVSDTVVIETKYGVGFTLREQAALKAAS